MYKKSYSQGAPSLPFDAHMKRSYSSISRSTVSGSPTTAPSDASPSWPETSERPSCNPSGHGGLVIRGDHPEQAGKKSYRYLSKNTANLPDFVPGESVTPAKVFYERQYPPMPKVKSIYTEAKKAEYDGNLELAMELYLRAIECNDRADSAIKDYAGLLHMKGQTKMAIEFMESQCEKRKSAMGFRNLLGQLRATHEREISSEHNHLPKVVLVNVKDDTIDVELKTLQSILPNCLKISHVTFVNPILTREGFPSSKCALIEFSSHSSARKAVMVGKHDSIKCCWSPNTLIDTIEFIEEKTPIQLIKGGSLVKIFYAKAHPYLMETEWPKLILQSLPGSSNGTRETGEKQIANVPPQGDSDASLRLTLPIPDRRMPTQIVEIDISDMTDEEQSSYIMDWCMNTPSPVRHMACLI